MIIENLMFAFLCIVSFSALYIVRNASDGKLITIFSSIIFLLLFNALFYFSPATVSQDKLQYYYEVKKCLVGGDVHFFTSLFGCVDLFPSVLNLNILFSMSILPMLILISRLSSRSDLVVIALAWVLFDRYLGGMAVNTLRSNFVIFSILVVLLSTNYSTHMKLLIIILISSFHPYASLLLLTTMSVAYILSYGVVISRIFVSIAIVVFILKFMLETSLFSGNDLEKIISFKLTEGQQVLTRGLFRTFELQISLFIQLSISLIMLVLLCLKEDQFKSNRILRTAAISVSLALLLYPEIIAFERLLFPLSVVMFLILNSNIKKYLVLFKLPFIFLLV